MTDDDVVAVAAMVAMKTMLLMTVLRRVFRDLHNRQNDQLCAMHYCTAESF